MSRAQAQDEQEVEFIHSVLLAVETRYAAYAAYTAGKGEIVRTKMALVTQQLLQIDRTLVGMAVHRINSGKLRLLVKDLLPDLTKDESEVGDFSSKEIGVELFKLKNGEYNEWYGESVSDDEHNRKNGRGTA